MKYIKIILIIIFPMFFLNSKCFKEEDKKEWLRVKNNLTVPVYCLCSKNYPDTSLNFTDKDKITGCEGHLLVVNGQEQKLDLCWICNKETWKNVDIVILFVISKNTFEKNTLEDIYSKNLILRKYYLTEEYLKKNDCRITIK